MKTIFYVVTFKEWGEDTHFPLGGQIFNTRAGAEEYRAWLENDPERPVFLYTVEKNIGK